MLFLVVGDEFLDATVDMVQELIDFNELGFEQCLRVVNALVEHFRQLYAVEMILLGLQVEFVEQD